MIGIYIIISIVLFFLCFVLGGILYDCELDIASLIIPASIFLAWIIFFAVDLYKTEVITEEKILFSFTESGVDGLLDENQFFNLNSYFQKDLEPKTKILKKTTIYDRILLDDENVEYFLGDNKEGVSL